MYVLYIYLYIFICIYCIYLYIYIYIYTGKSVTIMIFKHLINGMIMNRHLLLIPKK